MDTADLSLSVPNLVWFSTAYMEINHFYLHKLQALLSYVCVETMKTSAYPKSLHTYNYCQREIAYTCARETSFAMWNELSETNVCILADQITFWSVIM